jgi:hypothetical protein
MDLYYSVEQRNGLLALVAGPGGWDALLRHLQGMAPDFELFKVSTEWADQVAPFPPLKAKGVFGDLLIHFPDGHDVPDRRDGGGHCGGLDADLDAAAGAAGVEVAARLGEVRALTRDADAKAGALLTATGILAAAAAVVGPGLGHAVAGVWVRVAVVAAGVGLVTAVLALLAVLAPRGGRPERWLALAPGQQLARVAAIAVRKQALLCVAVRALTVAVLAGAAAAVVMVAR